MSMIGVANPRSSLEARWTPTWTPSWSHGPSRSTMPCRTPRVASVAAGGRDRPEADRGRAAHPGGPPSPGGLCLRGPLAALCPYPTCAGCFPTCPARPATTSGCGRRSRCSDTSSGRWRSTPSCGVTPCGLPTPPDRVRPVPGDGQALGPGRLGGLRLLPLAHPLLLGAAAAPGLYLARPAGRLRAGQPQS